MTLIGDPMLLSLVIALCLCMAALGIVIRANRRMVGAAQVLRTWLAAPDRGAEVPLPADSGAGFAALARALDGELKRAAEREQRLEHSERRYRTIFERAV